MAALAEVDVFRRDFISLLLWLLWLTDDLSADRPFAVAAAWPLFTDLVFLTEPFFVRLFCSGCATPAVVGEAVLVWLLWLLFEVVLLVSAVDTEEAALTISNFDSALRPPPAGFRLIFIRIPASAIGDPLGSEVPAEVPLLAPIADEVAVRNRDAAEIPRTPAVAAGLADVGNKGSAGLDMLAEDGNDASGVVAVVVLLVFAEALGTEEGEVPLTRCGFTPNEAGKVVKSLRSMSASRSVIRLPSLSSNWVHSSSSSSDDGQSGEQQSPEETTVDALPFGIAPVGVVAMVEGLSQEFCSWNESVGDNFLSKLKHATGEHSVVDEDEDDEDEESGGGEKEAEDLTREDGGDRGEGKVKGDAPMMSGRSIEHRGRPSDKVRNINFLACLWKRKWRHTSARIGSFQAEPVESRCIRLQTIDRLIFGCLVFTESK